MTSPSTAFFRTSAAEAREAETVANALDDRQTLERLYEIMRDAMGRLFENRVTLCDAGCLIDLQAIVETFRPHDAKTVEASARKVAARFEEDMG